jgi:hypothetical protein
MHAASIFVADILEVNLLGVFTPLDQHMGHKMEGRGFLVKDAGGDRVNIVALEMLDSSCPP